VATQDEDLGDLLLRDLSLRNGLSGYFVDVAGLDNPGDGRTFTSDLYAVRKRGSGQAGLAPTNLWHKVQAVVSKARDSFPIVCSS
jgi:hypothetical protein